jgi:hypothetical protein
MRQLWLVGAALAVTILQSNDAFAQRGGARAGVGFGGFHGAAMVGAHRGVTMPSVGGAAVFHRAVVSAGSRGLAMQRAPIHAGTWTGWGWRGRWGWPGAVGVVSGGAGFYSDTIDDPCAFLTHHGWINTCF